MDDFTADEMDEFGMVAAEPYLHLHKLLNLEGGSYGPKTTCYARTAESADRNWTSGLVCLEFRSGVVILKAELWQCYEGEGKDGLDERWDIGTAIFPMGVSNAVLAGVLGYTSTTDRIVSGLVGFKIDFINVIKQFEALFQKHIKRHETPFPEPQEESARAAVQAMIEAASE